MLSRVFGTSIRGRVLSCTTGVSDVHMCTFASLEILLREIRGDLIIAFSYRKAFCPLVLPFIYVERAPPMIAEVVLQPINNGYLLHRTCKLLSNGNISLV